MLPAMVEHFCGAEVGSDVPNHVQQALKREFANGEFVGSDMESLWIMLDRLILRSGGLPPGENCQILNLACGHCEEAAVLSAFFGRGDRTVRQFAIDLRDPEISEGRRRYAATEEMFKRAGIPAVKEDGSFVEFIADDATRLVGYGQIPAEYDVIFIRHQNFWHDAMIWRRIFEFALHRLASPHGRLVITSYFDREHLLALELLRKIGGRVLQSERNPRSRGLAYQGKSVDRHVAVLTKSHLTRQKRWSPHRERQRWEKQRVFPHGVPRDRV